MGLSRARLADDRVTDTRDVGDARGLVTLHGNF